MAEYFNRGQYGEQGFAWNPAERVFSSGMRETAPGYLPGLLQLQDRVRAGQAAPYEREWYNRMVEDARAIPTRDIGSLTAGWQGESQGQWTDKGWEPGAEDWWTRLDPGSPDVGPIMLQLKDKLDRGQATDQERALFQQVGRMAADWDYRASVPQASDAFSPLGDNLMGALGVIALGASGGLAAGALAGGGLGLGATLGASGTLAGTAGTGASIIGGATDQPWLQKAGLALGALGGVAGGVGGLANLWGTGVQSLADAAQLAQSGGRILGSVGRASGVEPLQRAAGYLSQAGQLGNLGAGVLPQSVTDWSAPTGAPGVSNLLSAADVATQRGGGTVSDFDWTGEPGPWLSNAAPDMWGGGYGAYSSPDYFQSDAYQNFTGWGGDETQQPWYQGAALDTSGGGGNWLSTLLGGAGAVAGFSAKTPGRWGRWPRRSAGWPVAPLALGRRGTPGGTGGGTQPWHRPPDRAVAPAAGQSSPVACERAAGPWPAPGPDGAAGTGHARGDSGHQRGALRPSRCRARLEPAYVPGTARGQRRRLCLDAGAGTAGGELSLYPGPDAGRGGLSSGAPQLYQGAMPGTQVSTLTGQQVLDQDPGAAFRQTEARKALEASAAARGGLLSGSTLGALQRQSQDLASQEYGNAWQRMMARDTEQYGRNWGQYQQAWNQGVTGTQLGLQTNAQNFGQALAASQVREQVNQVASQQGWNQAQAEAAFREQMGQLASQQGWSQALQGQQTAYQQGLESDKWNTGQYQSYDQDQYQRQLQQAQLRYGWDVNQNTTDYARTQALYQQQLQEQARQWTMQSTLAGYGQTATNQVGNQGLYANEALGKLYGQLGSAQAIGTLGQAGQQQGTINSILGAGNTLLKNLNA